MPLQTKVGFSKCVLNCGVTYVVFLHNNKGNFPEFTRTLTTDHFRTSTNENRPERNLMRLSITNRKCYTFNTQENTVNTTSILLVTIPNERQSKAYKKNSYTLRSHINKQIPTNPNHLCNTLVVVLAIQSIYVPKIFQATTIKI